MKKLILKSNRRRIISNYLRLFFGLAVGLLVTRLLLSAGKDVFAVYTLITVGMGVSIMLTELLRMGFVPELGQHVINGQVEDIDTFRSSLSVTFLISFGAAVFGAVVMFILAYFMLQHIEPVTMQYAAWTFLWMRIAMMLVVVTLTPIATILLVSDRQPQFNLLLSFERGAELLAVALPLVILAEQDFPQSSFLIIIGVSVSFFTAMIHITTAVLIIRFNPSFRLTFSIPANSAVLKILKGLGWSSLQTISMNLYARADILIASVFLGTTGVAALGIALRLMGYVRQGTTGLVNGLDATFANLKGHQNRNQSKNSVDDGGHQIIELSSALQACVIFPTAAIMIFAGPEIIHLWIGGAMSNSPEGLNVGLVAQLSSLMVIGIGIRSLTLGWMSAMTGSGMARKFTPWLVPGSLVNIVFVIGWAYLFPQSFSILVVGWSFLVLQAITHGVFLPYIASRALNISLSKLFVPFAIPALFTSIATIFYVGIHDEISKLAEMTQIFIALFSFFSASAASLIYSMLRGHRA